MGLQHLSADTTAEAVAEAVARDGAVIVDRLVGDDVMDRVAEEVAPHLEATAYGPDDFSGRATRRTGLIARSPAARELLMHPLMRATVDRVLGHATSHQVHLTQVIAIGPGQGAQPVHRDQWAFDFFPFPPGYDVQCNTIWALTDFTDDNGATRVVPGSHTDEDHHRYTAADTVPAEMARGSVLVYNGRVYHGGGENRSDAVRLGVNLTYCVSWVRQEENQYLSVPPEVARTLPVDLLKLMGYDRGAYALGYVDDLRHPLEALGIEVDGGDGFGGELSAVDAAAAAAARR